MLAQHYLTLANLEEDCAHRQSPFARPQDDKAPEAAPVSSVAARMFAAAIANGGAIHRDRLHAADGGRRDTGR